LRRSEADLDRRIWWLRIHDHGVVRLHIHELVFDLPDRLQAKFLRFFGANHEWTLMDTNVKRSETTTDDTDGFTAEGGESGRGKPRITQPGEAATELQPANNAN